MAVGDVERPEDDRLTHEELGVRPFPPAPDGFDPVGADDDDLQRYGYPARPDAVRHPEAFARWHQRVTPATVVVVPEFGQVPPATGQRYGDNPPPVFPTSGISQNWAGVVVFAEPDDPLDGVFGSWSVPNVVPVAAESPPFICAAWIGIGGFALGQAPTPAGAAEASIVQAGVTRLLSAGFPRIDTTYAWWEWVPAGPVRITNLPVRPGDMMHCEITMPSSTEASFHLTNMTTKVMTSFIKEAPAGTQSFGVCAEWIVELPNGGVPGNPLNLAQFGTVYFDDAAAATRNGANVDAGSGDFLSMVDASDHPLAIASPLSEKAFRVRFSGGGHGV